MKIMESERIETYQFIRETLPYLVFKFFSDSMIHLLDKIKSQRKRIFVVLDNSQLNYSRAPFNFVV